MKISCRPGKDSKAIIDWLDLHSYVVCRGQRVPLFWNGEYFFLYHKDHKSANQFYGLRNGSFQDDTDVVSTQIFVNRIIEYYPELRKTLADYLPHFSKPENKYFRLVRNATGRRQKKLYRKANRIQRREICLRASAVG
jgi:hypothetical protein